MELRGQKDVLEPLTKDQKDAKWKAICYRQTERAEELHKAGMVEVATFLILELMGGPCPKCKTPWEKVVFDNDFGAGEYYKPSCTCYPKCPRCKRNLYVEYVDGTLADMEEFCPNCKYPVNGMAERSVIESAKKRGLDEYEIKLISKYFEKYRSPV